MAPSMGGKRKRADPAVKTSIKKVAISAPETREYKPVRTSSPITQPVPKPQPLRIQVVTGSYERVLHGFIATFPLDKQSSLTFSESFLFAAHSSAIRCLAISPPTAADKRLLATGSTDERINVYSIATTPPKEGDRPVLPSLAGASTITENPLNRSLGSLVHHDRAVTHLHFASKSKLFSGAEDNTIAISRTRDWTVLSSIKAPIPKPQGRPSGDTAAAGDTPAGISDLAIHPSQKLMISVGRGERCMRLWNLMTGKKAGVLNFDRSLLTQAGETRFSSGEGRKVVWNPSGELFVVGFERGAVVFGIDSQPKAVIRPLTPTKFHQMRFVSIPDSLDLLCVSTEDGKVLFFETNGASVEAERDNLPLCRCVAQLGGGQVGASGRLKDFEIVALDERQAFMFVTANSNGAVRFWKVTAGDLVSTIPKPDHPKQVGELTGSIETNDRITCLGAFIMDGSSTDRRSSNGISGKTVGAESSDDE